MKTCEYVIEGNPKGSTIVFIHGWPDDASLWRQQVTVLGEEYRCVLVTLPNFGEKAVKPGGFDFPEVAELLAATIREVQPVGRVSLVTHDWGAYLGYMFEKAHPEMVETMIALDVGGHLGRLGVKSMLMIMAYQWALIASWLVGGLAPAAGRRMTLAVGRVVRVPRRQQARIESRFNYLYFYFWRNMLVPWKRSGNLNRYRPCCNVLYLFGEKKPLMFHSSRWLEILDETGGRGEGIGGAGHWLMETHADVVNGEIIDWLTARGAPSTPPGR